MSDTFAPGRSRTLSAALPTFRTVAIAAALLVLPAIPVLAEEPAADEVVARINGLEITRTDLDYAAADFASEMARIPPEKQERVLVDVLVDLHLFATAAEKEGLDKTPEFERRLSFLRARALRNVYFKQKIEDMVSDSEARALYDEEIAKIEPEDEVRARHILVETEDEAKAIAEQLKNGADFAELAKEKSLDPGSGAEGGDLGYFSLGRMVPEFEAVAFMLDVGAVSEPFKSKFGWHILKVEDKRKQELPSFESIEPQIRQFLLQEKFGAELDRLKADAKIEILLPDAEDDKPADDQAAGSDDKATDAPAAGAKSE